MIKTLTLKIEIVVAVINLMTFLYFLFFTPAEYTAATIPPVFIMIMFVYVPIVLTLLSMSVFVYDLVRYKQKNWFCFLVTTLAMLPTSIFIICTFIIIRHP